MTQEGHTAASVGSDGASALMRLDLSELRAGYTYDMACVEDAGLPVSRPVTLESLDVLTLSEVSMGQDFVVMTVGIRSGLDAIKRAPLDGFVACAARSPEGNIPTTINGVMQGQHTWSGKLVTAPTRVGFLRGLQPATPYRLECLGQWTTTRCLDLPSERTGSCVEELRFTHVAVKSVRTVAASLDGDSADVEHSGAPRFFVSSIKPYGDAVSLRVVLAEPGKLWCTVCDLPCPYLEAAVVELQGKENVVPDESVPACFTLEDLQPSTEYRLLCVTRGLNGAVTSLAEIREQTTSFVTHRSAHSTPEDPDVSESPIWVPGVGHLMVAVTLVLSVLVLLSVARWLRGATASRDEREMQQLRPANRGGYVPPAMFGFANN